MQPSSPAARRPIRLLRLLGIGLLALLPLAGGAAPGERAVAQTSPAARALSVTIPPPRRAQIPTLDEPPPPPAGLSDGPNLGAPVRDDGQLIPPPAVAETGAAAEPRPQADGSFVTLRNSELATPAGFSSSVNEPSVGTQGQAIFTTYNWYAAASVDNGETYTYISPFNAFPLTPAAFGAGFCCDQRATQDASRDLIFWYLQYSKTGSLASSTNGVRIAVADGQADVAANTWDYYDFTPEQFGLSGKWLDFPHMQVSANYLYFTSNIFQTTNDGFYGAIIVRIPLDQLDSGSALTVDSFQTTAYGSIMAVSGAGASGSRPGRTTMYFGALATTSSIRVLSWPEAAAAPSEAIVGGLTTTSTGTFVCVGPAPDSNDPCTRASVRMQTGWITDAELGLMWHSSQNGAPGSAATRPYPYTRVAILNPQTLAVISQPDIWGSTSAWLYPALAVNQRGDIGGVIDNLGGNIFPTVRALIRDGFSPDVAASGWESYQIATSTHGTLGRWGDYNGAVAHEQYPNTWVAVGHTQSGGNVNTNSRTRNFWFGRERDTSPTLTVSKAGTGTGMVSSSPAGVDCGADCSEAYTVGTEVTLTVDPDLPATFAGWSGACTGIGDCIVTMDQARAVTATFNLPIYTLTVTRDGTGSGTVTSIPAGIDCGADCSQEYDAGTVVNLSATPDAGSSFTGWGGACDGADGCAVTIEAASTVSATFADVTPPVTSASVAGDPAPAGCPANSFAPGATVTLSVAGDQARVAGSEYRIGASGAFQPYSAPFTLAEEGSFTVQFRSTDTAGNTEAAKSRSVVLCDPPRVVAISRAGPAVSAAAALDFTVTFSEDVSGVDAADFAAEASGVTSPTVSAVAGGGSAWTVTVTSGGSGSLGLGLVDDDSIVDGAGFALAGDGTADGGFGGAPGYSVDRAAPTASLSAPDLAADGSAVYTFTVVLSDNLALDAGSLDGDDLLVSGPGGFSQLATFVGVAPAGDGAPRTATYRIAAPGGSWDAADAGSYSVAVRAGQIRDTAGNALPAQSLGGFSVTASAGQKIFLPVLFR